jgi:hypothetical protein
MEILMLTLEDIDYLYAGLVRISDSLYEIQLGNVSAIITVLDNERYSITMLVDGRQEHTHSLNRLSELLELAELDMV